MSPGETCAEACTELSQHRRAPRPGDAAADECANGSPNERPNDFFFVYVHEILSPRQNRLPDAATPPRLQAHLTATSRKRRDYKRKSPCIARGARTIRRYQLTGSPRARPSLEFGLLLQRLMDERPIDQATGVRPRPFSKRDLAAAIGIEERTVRNWVNGLNVPDETNLTRIEQVIFSNEAGKYRDQIKQLRATARNGRLQRSVKGRLPPVPESAVSRRTFSDPVHEFPNLGYADLDLLPVVPDWRFQEVRYGEGVQSIGIAASRLLWLEATCQMLDSEGTLRPLTAYFPESTQALEAMERETDICFPRRVFVTGTKNRDVVVRLYACTDVAYPQAFDDNPGEQYGAAVILGRGGLAAFVDRSGELFTRTDIEIGNGYGCVAALTAVAYRDARPVYRSPYCLVIRKGIRYPDDVWLSPAIGRPVLSSSNLARARFLFQSRESKGGYLDMFVANFNGSEMMNLNEFDECAWDGFTDEEGNDLVRWNENFITFGSRVNGNGFIEAITREDNPAFY